MLSRSLILCLLFAPAASAFADDPDTQGLTLKFDESVFSVSDAFETDPEITLGGAFRFQYVLQESRPNNTQRGGELEFDLVALNANATAGDFLFSSQYRWYAFQEVVHHGWIGWKFSDSTHVEFGITQVPFGLLPYASHSFWFGTPYYLGFEDDYDAGLKLVTKWNDWDLQTAFFKNAEYPAARLERYSFDLVTGGTQQNEEINQWNGRLARTFEHSCGWVTEVGVSAEIGQVFNRVTTDTDVRWSSAVHVSSEYNDWQLQVQGLRYEFNAPNPAGMSDETVQVGAFGVRFPLASRGTVLVLNVAHEVPITLGPIEKLTFYNDYSVLFKDGSSHESVLNVTGCLVTAGKLFVYIDLILGRNHIFLGPNNQGLGLNGSDDEFHPRFNVNFGVYF